MVKLKIAIDIQWLKHSVMAHPLQTRGLGLSPAMCRAFFLRSFVLVLLLVSRVLKEVHLYTCDGEVGNQPIQNSSPAVQSGVKLAEKSYSLVKIRSFLRDQGFMDWALDCLVSGTQASPSDSLSLLG